MATKPIRSHDNPLLFSDASGQIKLGQRICVYGRGGKTSLSRAIGDLTGLPVIELDSIFWLPNWVERDQDEMLEIVMERIQHCKRGWIVEGNYSKIRPHVLPMADTAIWLNMQRWSTTLRIARRTIANAIKGTRICGDNYESLRTAISPKSVIWYTAIHGGKSQNRIAPALQNPELKATVYELRSYRELDQFYHQLGIDQRSYLT